MDNCEIDCKFIHRITFAEGEVIQSVTMGKPIVATIGFRFIVLWELQGKDCIAGSLMLKLSSEGWPGKPQNQPTTETEAPSDCKAVVRP